MKTVKEIDKEIATLQSSPRTSEWLKAALSAVGRRDPVDLLGDAELLTALLKSRLDAVFRESMDAQK